MTTELRSKGNTKSARRDTGKKQKRLWSHHASPSDNCGSPEWGDKLGASCISPAEGDVGVALIQ
ncbi:hypothetical protein EWB00_000118 [Schistosoma japonicum]|uniref:Uncharacterized protein n=1 Tax=Schistosoma japonicum TaxID=6182 RepID=A0A4Z2CKD3_SCHJA|nr:hypothetical protein EWB00_000118 [Schistosoma japonicum]